jgi:hypothetical protein
VSGFPAQEFLKLEVNGVQTVIPGNGLHEIATLIQGSDYSISINDQSAGAGCFIVGSINGMLDGVYISEDFTFDVTCGAP